MKDWGLVLVIFGAGFIFFGKFYTVAYQKGLGEWPYRAFVGMAKLGIILLVVGLPLLVLSAMV